MLAPASKLINIENNVTYKDTTILIYTLHCTQTNECEVTFLSIEGNKVIFPPGSFIRGAVYNIYVYKMIFDESKASFIGYASSKVNN